MSANNKFAYILLKRSLRYLMHRIIDSIQENPSMEATSCSHLVHQILHYYDPKVAEECKISNTSFAQHYFNNLICNGNCSHEHVSMDDHCLNCRCAHSSPTISRTFFTHSLQHRSLTSLRAWMKGFQIGLPQVPLPLKFGLVQSFASNVALLEIQNNNKSLPYP